MLHNLKFYLLPADQCARSRPDLADFFGVSTTTLQRWLDGRTPVPLAALKLARLRWRGDLSALFGAPWAELSVNEAGLQLPGMRRPLSLADLRSVAARLAELPLLRHEVARLTKEAERAQTALERAEDAREWYRRQLRLESRLGAMLQTLAA
jgi:hypothetical protein